MQLNDHKQNGIKMRIKMRINIDRCSMYKVTFDANAAQRLKDKRQTVN